MTEPQVAWPDMSTEQISAAYNNSAAVGNFPQILSRFQAQSLAFYAKHPELRRVHYGSHERQCLDWVGAAGTAANAPLFLFIHGGYWQYCAKEDFSFIARGPLAHGMHVALVEYRLAPQVSMTDIVADIGACLDHLHTHAAALGIDTRHVCLSGHSAGGHLTALFRGHPLVTHAMPISALVDLAPIARTHLNQNLQLTEAQVKAFSPVRHLLPAGKPCTVVVGAAELPELVRHSVDYTQACRQAGDAVDYLALPGAHHFSVLDDLADPQGQQMLALQRMFDKSVFSSR
jgi:acetyl esterase/lipase